MVRCARAMASAALEYEADGSAGATPFEARESLSRIRRLEPKPGSLTERGFAGKESGFGDGVPAPLLGSWAWLTARPTTAAESPPSRPTRRPLPKPRSPEAVNEEINGDVETARPKRERNGNPASNVKFRRPPPAVANLADVYRVAWNAGLGVRLSQPLLSGLD